MVRSISLSLVFVIALGCESSDGSSALSLANGDGDETGEDPIDGVCDPSAPQACELAQGICCSDDPAAVLLSNLDAQVTPLYEGGNGEGSPIFSGSNNSLSRWGVCVAAGTVPTDSALTEPAAAGCPVPCDPEWSATDVETICGTGQTCCQSVELEPEDCGLDPELGDAGCWRPVTGADIEGFGGIDASVWETTAHATHQDPNGTGCREFVGETGSNQELAACFRRLSVANRRGFCVSATSSCPYAGPAYVDACEQRNLDEQRTGC